MTPSYITMHREHGRYVVFRGSGRLTWKRLRSLAKRGFTARTRQVGEPAAAGGVFRLVGGQMRVELATLRRRKWRTP